MHQPHHHSRFHQQKRVGGGTTLGPACGDGARFEMAMSRGIQQQKPMQLSVVAAANMPCEWESSMVDSE
jgi:hypothetical protein